MTATHRSRAPYRTRGVWVSLALIPLGLPALAAEERTELSAETPIAAVHKVQEMSFSYRSQGQIYSCNELEQRVAIIMRAIGARDDISVQARNCDAVAISGDTSMDIDPYGHTGSDPFGRDRTDPFGRDRDPFNRGTASGSFRRQGYEREQSAHIRIRFMMPVEVTPEVTKEIEKDKSRRELISRVNRDPAAAMNDPVVFAALRQEVTLDQRTLRLKAEDCPLLQQMTTQVIRKLDVKVKDQSFHCGPRSSSRIPPQLTVEALLPTGALMPMPEPEKKTQSAQP